jgi:hypothetical protein
LSPHLLSPPKQEHDLVALYRNQSIPEIVAHLDLVLPDEINSDIAKSALTQACQRLALHYLRYEWSRMAITSPGKLPAHLQRLRIRLGEMVRPKQRRGRECPRIVKALPQRYPIRQIRKSELK